MCLSSTLNTAKGLGSFKKYRPITESQDSVKYDAPRTLDDTKY